VSDVMAGLDVLVVPSIWYENDPRSIQEAFACGVPVVASDLGAMSEKIRDGVDGVLFRPGDALHLAHVLKRLASNADLCNRLSEGTRPPPSISDVAAKFEHLYELAL
jgi:glycosyltransferase involved in cell wall biosynthesis